MLFILCLNEVKKKFGSGTCDADKRLSRNDIQKKQNAPETISFFYCQIYRETITIKTTVVMQQYQ